MTWDLIIAGFERQTALFSLRKLLENEEPFYASLSLERQDSLCTVSNEIFADRDFNNEGRATGACKNRSLRSF